jgi:hypothetical protein
MPIHHLSYTYFMYIIREGLCVLELELGVLYVLP